jgi:hypothetical protein
MNFTILSLLSAFACLVTIASVLAAVSIQVLLGAYTAADGLSRLKRKAYALR